MSSEDSLSWTDLITKLCNLYYYMRPVSRRSAKICPRLSASCPNAPRITPMQGDLDDIPSLSLPPSAEKVEGEEVLLENCTTMF